MQDLTPDELAERLLAADAGAGCVLHSPRLKQIAAALKRLAEIDRLTERPAWRPIEEALESAAKIVEEELILDIGPNSGYSEQTKSTIRIENREVRKAIKRIRALIPAPPTEGPAR